VMRRGRGRWGRAATAVLVSVGAMLAPTAPAAAGMVSAPRLTGKAGYCPDANGVTVVIDFQELGGATIVRCAVGDQATGLAALKNAGISITGTSRWGEAFICRIEGKPTAATEPCIDTPPTTAYWSYWHAPNGGTWTYSQVGVMNRKPPLGSFEGWSFSLNKTASTAPPPRIAPVRPAAPKPSAAPSTVRSKPPKPLSKPTPPPATAGSPAVTQPAGSPTANPTAATDTASALPGSADATTWTGDVGRAAGTTDDRGLPVATLVGVGVLGAVTAGGLLTARRRRALD